MVSKKNQSNIEFFKDLFTEVINDIPKDEPQTNSSENIHQLTPTNTNLNQLPQTSTNLNQSTPTNTNLNQPTSINSTGGHQLTPTTFFATEKQMLIYNWLVKNSDKGKYNRGILARDLKISGETIKTAILKFKKLKVLVTGLYDYGSKSIPYQIDFNRPVKSVLQYSFHQPTPTYTNSSYKTDRKIININLSISEFWKAQGLTDSKFQKWVKEFSFTQDEWETQLSFGEYEPKVTQADSPIKYFYRALQKGGVTRPIGFEFPEEKRLRIQQEENKRREDLLRLKEETKKKEQELADRETFLMFLDDKESVLDAVKEIEKQFMTSTIKTSVKNYNTSGKIDSRLENKLKQIFLSS